MCLDLLCINVGFFLHPLLANCVQVLRVGALYRLQQAIILPVAPSFLLDSLLLTPQLAFLSMSSGCCY